MKAGAALTAAELSAFFQGLDTVRIGLIGDLCLDLYWKADMRLSELSRETPHYPLPVVEERYQPGGAGNVAANLAALQPGTLCVLGLIGEDWRGDLLLRALGERGIDTSRILRRSGIMTNTYIKPLRTGISNVIYEDPRLDFEARQPVDTACEARVIAALEEMATHVDVICVSDQMKYGIVTERVRQTLCTLGQQGKTVIVDSRDRIGEYHHVIIKPNEVEAARAFGTDPEDLEQLAGLAGKISEKNSAPALITLGSKGCMAAQNGQSTYCPACKVEPPLDFCGAGDTFLAGFGLALGSGVPVAAAAKIANLCSAVTIQKLGTTGTVTRQELVQATEQYLQLKIKFE